MNLAKKLLAVMMNQISSGLWNETSVVMQHILDAANAYHTLEGSATRSTLGATLTGTFKWNGVVLAPNGKIYCVPYVSTNILIIDPVANTTTRSALGATLSDSSKFTGGVLASNGKIYGVPSSSADILVIDKNASVPALDIKDCLSPHLNKF